MPVGEEPNGDFLSEIESGAARLPGDLVFGPEHRSLVSAMEEVFSAALAGAAPAYNPVVLHGGNGLGKTHLLRAMGEALRPVLGRNSVQYIRAAEFAQEMLEAIDADDISAWRGRYRDAQWFVLDDLEHLAGKPVAQDELTRTIDLLVSEGRQVAVIAHGPVAKVGGLIPSLAARLAGGLSVRMPTPERETRGRVLRRLSLAKQARFTEGAIERLAAGYEASPVALAGAVTQLQAIGGNAEIDLAAVDAYLDEHGGAQTITLRDIAVATARHYSLTLPVLRGTSRRKSVAGARGVAMWLARQLTDASLERIGTYFGGRDHTTVLHACRRMDEETTNDSETRRAVEEIRLALANRP
jgi:chromosomal replication initiator protein